VSQPDANPPADFTVSLPESWRAAIEQRGGPAERIEVIEDSLRCYAYGWLSCLPVIGVAWLYPAVRRFVQARRRQAEWNPARGYLAAGLALASGGWMVGLVSWLVSLNAVVVLGELAASDAGAMNLLPAVLFFGCPPAVAGLVIAGALAWERLSEVCQRFRWLVVVLGLGFYFSAWLAFESPSARSVSSFISSCFFNIGQ